MGQPEALPRYDHRAQLIQGLAAKGSAALIDDKYVVPQRWKTTYGHGRSQIVSLKIHFLFLLLAICVSLPSSFFPFLLAFPLYAPSLDIATPRLPSLSLSSYRAPSSLHVPGHPLAATSGSRSFFLFRSIARVCSRVQESAQRLHMVANATRLRTTLYASVLLHGGGIGCLYRGYDWFIGRRGAQRGAMSTVFDDGGGDDEGYLTPRSVDDGAHQLFLTS